LFPAGQVPPCGVCASETDSGRPDIVTGRPFF